MLGSDQGTRQEVKRKASLEVPADLLKGTDTLRIQVSFDNGTGDGDVQEALTIRLGNNRRLERVTLRLDLEIKGK
jgi:hypothetical protein